MGQQQLLLLVFGIIIVALATVSGISIFKLKEAQYEDDREREKMLELVIAVQAWKIKPEMFGGGANGNETDYSEFSLVSIGLEASGNPGTSPYVEFENVGCFRFFPAANELRINALDEDCVLGSWDKGIIVSGVTHEDITWLFPNP